MKIWNVLALALITGYWFHHLVVKRDACWCSRPTSSGRLCCSATKEILASCVYGILDEVNSSDAGSIPVRKPRLGAKAEGI
jgi:hypothetical protein